MRAVIITGGTISDYAYTKNLIQPHDTIICADSGYDHALAMDLIPNVLIGDLDSIREVPSGVPVMQHPMDKDFTDTELALNYASDKGYKDILLLGGLGNRMDHSMANIMMLVNFQNTIIVNENNKIQIGKKIELRETKGTLVSLIPLSMCSGIYTENLKYPLQNASMQVGHSLGVSNVMTDAKASVIIEKGDMLVIVARD